jgi:SSS family solute:Na+ symporter
MPFLDQMFYTCILTMAIIVLVSLPNCPGEDDVKGIALTGDMFQTKRDFHIAAYTILVLLVVIYAVFW